MNKYILIAYCLFLNYSFSQESKKVFIRFNSKNNELCEISKYEMGRYHTVEKVKKYVKSKSHLEKYSFRFYICKELFLAKNEIDTCSTKYLNNIEFSRIEDLRKTVSKINPLYPSKVFPNLYLIEKISDSTLAKYKVKWQYYVE